MLTASELQKVVDEAARSHNVPGAGVSVAFNEGRLHAASGTANAQTRVQVHDQTKFFIGSITKAFTATLLLHYADRGLLDLDQPVAEILPELRLGSARLTRDVSTRQLLTHTSGIPGDLIPESGSAIGNDVRLYLDALADIGELHAPREMYSYCNSGFVLAGEIASTVAGLPWFEALKQDLLIPIGANSFAASPPAGRDDDFAPGHTVAEGVARVGRMWEPFQSGAAAGWTPVATPQDLLLLADLISNDGTSTNTGARILRPETVRQMVTPGPAIPSGSLNTLDMGLGVMRFTYGGNIFLGHNGGSSAVLRFSPSLNVQIAILTNSASGAAMADEVLERILPDLVHNYKEGLDRPPDLREIPPDAVKTMVGRYVHLDSELHVRSTPSGPNLARFSVGWPSSGTIALWRNDHGQLVGEVPGEPARILAYIPETETAPPYFHCDGRAWVRVVRPE